MSFVLGTSSAIYGTPSGIEAIANYIGAVPTPPEMSEMYDGVSDYYNIVEFFKYFITFAIKNCCDKYRNQCLL